MTRVVLYGTLMHGEHRAAVLGREAEVLPVVLEGWRRGRAGAAWPVLAPEAGARTRAVALDAGAGDLARLDRYEGAHGHARGEVTLADGGVAVAYLPAGDAPGATGDWSLGDWARDWAEIAVETAREAMAEAGDLAATMPSIRRRAAARVAARARGEDRRGDVEILRRDRPYSGFYALEEFDLRHRLFDGGWSEPMTRAALLGFDAAIVLPYDPGRDRVLLIEQFRVGYFARGAANPWAVEPVAGLIDPGEAPEDAARREAREEAGVEVRALHRVAAGYACPGNVTEFHHSFVGVCDLPDDAAGLGGLAEEHEDLRAHLMPAGELIARAGDGRLDNAPLVLCALWLALHRERLRDGGA